MSFSVVYFAQAGLKNPRENIFAICISCTKYAIFMPFQRFEPPVTTIRLVLRCYLTAMRFVAKSYPGGVPHGILGGITTDGISEREKQHPAPSRNLAGWSTENRRLLLRLLHKIATNLALFAAFSDGPSGASIGAFWAELPRNRHIDLNKPDVAFVFTVC